MVFPTSADVLIEPRCWIRPSESRALTRSNVQARWINGVISEAEVSVGRSKTEAGSGRIVPLTSQVRAALAD